MTERTVHFTESFFDRLEELLPSERCADGTPSITDFLMFDIPALRDRLARDAIKETLATAIPGVRACISTGILISGFVAYALVDDHDVEVFALSFDTD